MIETVNNKSIINRCTSAPGLPENENTGFDLVFLSEGQSYDCTIKNKYNNLAFVLQGEVEFSYNEYVGRRFREGDFYFVPKASESHCLAISDAELLVLSFLNSAELLDCNPGLSDYELVERAAYDFRALSMTGLVRRFADSGRSYIGDGIMNRFMPNIKKQEIFSLLRYEYSVEQLTGLFAPILGRNPEFRAKILEIAHENLTVDEMADRLNMSSRNFSRKFKEEFGESVRQWMLREKSKQIKLRLMVPGTTINDVINHFGFASPAYFNEYCKKYYDCTPGELIKQIRNK